MAFGWFKKNKNKNKSAAEAVAEQDAPRQIDEEPPPDSEAQEIAFAEIPESENQIAGPVQTANADFYDEPADNVAAAPESIGY